MLLSHRHNDAVIAMYQDNDQQDVIIHDLNPVAEELLGYQKDELIGRSLQTILPNRIAQTLSEYVEYEDFGNDVGSVLRKVSNFTVISKSSEELPIQVKIQRSTPVSEHDQFNLIVQSDVRDRREEAFRELLKENFRGHEVLDDNTGLPDRASLFKYAELVMFYVNKKELDASVAVIELDDADLHENEHGTRAVAKIIKHIAKLCRQSLRNDDTMGLISPTRIGLIMFDSKDDGAQMVLNRLRWLIAANGCLMDDNEMASLSVRVAYISMAPDVMKADQAFVELEASLDSGDVESNRVHQMTVAQ